MIVSEMILRILLSFFASVTFGLERQFRKKAVGFGTFTFVAIGAAVLTIVAQDISDTPITIFGAIVTGIGFLGAGAIIKQSDRKVSGLTTAASLWSFAALGITIGVGEYVLAGILYGLIIIIVMVDYTLETHGFGDYSKSVIITTIDLASIHTIEKMLPQKHKTFGYTFDKNKGEYSVSFWISGKKREINMTLNEILKQQGVTNIKVE